MSSIAPKEEKVDQVQIVNVKLASTTPTKAQKEKIKYKETVLQVDANLSKTSSIAAEIEKQSTLKIVTDVSPTKQKSKRSDVRDISSSSKDSSESDSKSEKKKKKKKHQSKEEELVYKDEKSVKSAVEEEDDYMELYVQKELREKFEPLQIKLTEQTDLNEVLLGQVDELKTQITLADSNFRGVVRALLARQGIAAKEISELSILQEFRRLKEREEKTKAKLKQDAESLSPKNKNCDELVS